MAFKLSITSRVLSGLLAGTVLSVGLVFVPLAAAAANVSALGCSVPAAAPLLTRWHDNNLYFPIIGGNAENSALWSFGGGAKPAKENEPWRVVSALDQYSIQLPAGSSASAAHMCVPFINNMRMFVKSPGVRGSSLHIHLDSLGSVLPIAPDYGKHHATADYWVGGGTAGWNLTGGISIPDGRGTDGTQFLTITLSTSGSNATWRVDDILMDPWKAH